ncbi:zinc-binding dehydrogenase [Nocardia sp. NPDC003482]
MRSIVNAPGTPNLVEFQDVPDPTPAPNHAVVAVRAFSINRGELALLKARPAGWRPGQDIAGVVVEAAADGSGPAAGTPVVGAAEEGGWAERVTVRTDQLAAVPEEVSLDIAATLPIAGITALRTLRLARDLLGRRVLVTAASGAVGRFQVELAAARGAEVTAVAASEYAAELADRGATTVVSTIEDAPGRYHVVSESVGGKSLSAAISKVEPGGLVLLIGTTSGEPGAVSIYDFIGHEGARIQSFLSYASGPFGADLGLLVSLVAKGILHPRIGYAGAWEDLPDALRALAERRVKGKAVLIIS